MEPQTLTPAQLDAALASGDPELIALARRFIAATEHPLNSWVPRPDNVAEHDQQSGFVASDSRVQVCLGGTGSGKSDAAAFKVAKFLLEQQPPPRRNCPFWVLSSTLDMSCGVLWGEKLSRFVPKQAIDHISWISAGMGHPRAVRLKPWKGTDHNWLIEFKAEAQGRQKLQAASIGGAWISECLNDWAIFDEILGRTRDYGWAKVIWDLCPLLPMVELEERYKQPPKGWSFFHQNTLCNQHLAAGWADDYLAGLPEEIRDTRCFGAFSSFEGAIYKELTAAHVVEPFDIPDEWPRFRGLDFGNNFACSFLAYDPDGCWYVTDEYYKEGGDLIANHAKRIKDVAGEILTTYGDPADPGSIRELNQHGVFVTGARKAVLEGIELVRKLLLAGRLKFFSSCQMTLQQHRAYRWEKQHGEKDAKPQPLKYWDHLCDAVRYVLYSRSLGMGDMPARPLEVKPRERGLAAKSPDGVRVRSASVLPVFRSRIPRRWG